MLRFLALALLVSHTAAAQIMTIEVAQESAPGVGDFDAHIVGTVQAYTTSGTVASFYGYNTTSRTYGNTVPATLLGNGVNTLFVVGSDGLALITLHGPRAGGGTSGRLDIATQHDLSVGAFVNPLAVTDDADDTFTFANGNTRLTATTSASSNRTDGFAARFTTSQPVFTSQITAAPTTTGWRVHGSAGTVLNLSTSRTLNRRVRFRASWKISPSALPVAQPTPAFEPGWRLLSVPFGGVDVLRLARINHVGGVPAGSVNPAQYPQLGTLNSRGQLAGNLYHRYEGRATIRNAAGTADSIAVVYTPVPTTDYVFESGKGIWWYWYDADFDLGTTRGGGVGRSYDLANPAFSLAVSGDARLSNVSATFPLASTISPTHDGDGNGIPDGLVPTYFYMGGNPFAQAFNVDGISATGGNVQGLVYTWEPAANGGSGGHVPRARSGTLNGTGAFVSVWQGILIEVTPTGLSGPTISYAHASTSTTQTPPFYGLTAQASVSTPEIRFTLSGSTPTGSVDEDYAWLRFLPDAVRGFDPQDGSKIAGGAAQISFPIDDGGLQRRLAMNALPDGTSEPLRAKEDIAMDFKADAAGTFTLAWANDLAPGWRAMLIDRVTGIKTTIRRGMSYTFTADASDWTSRFLVRVRPATEAATLVSVQKGDAEATIGQPSPNPAAETSRLAVVLAEAETVHIAVYDALGREVAVVHDGAMAAGSHTVALPVAGLAQGVYTVRVDSDSVAETRRLLVVR